MTIWHFIYLAATTNTIANEVKKISNSCNSKLKNQTLSNHTLKAKYLCLFYRNFHNIFKCNVISNMHWNMITYLHSFVKLFSNNQMKSLFLTIWVLVSCFLLCGWNWKSLPITNWSKQKDAAPPAPRTYHMLIKLTFCTIIILVTGKKIKK